MKSRGFTLIELLCVLVIFAIILTFVIGAVQRKNAQPVMLSQNRSGQQTWRVPEHRLQEFQTRFHSFKTISLTPITEGFDGNVDTVGYMIIIEPLPDEKPEAEEK